MTQTTRLSVVEARPRGFWRKKQEHPDPVLIGQLKMRVADACIEHMRSVFPGLTEQMAVHELIGDVLRDAERRLRAYGDEE